MGQGTAGSLSKLDPPGLGTDVAGRTSALYMPVGIRRMVSGATDCRGNDDPAIEHHLNPVSIRVPNNRLR